MTNVRSGKVTIRRLKPGEWHMLREVGDGAMPDEKNSIAVCAFNSDGDIVARIFAVAPAHLEGIYIDRLWRNGVVMAQLVDQVEKELAKQGITTVLAFALDEKMEDYIGRLGYTRSNVSLWVKEIR